MTQPININRFRKAKRKTAQAEQAAEDKTLHSRNKRFRSQLGDPEKVIH